MFSEMAVQSPISTGSIKRIHFRTSSIKLVMNFLLILDILVGMKHFLLGVLIHISLALKDVDHLFNANHWCIFLR